MFVSVCVSCYLASVVQVLFHLPSFHRRYWVEGQRHIAECRNGRPADCFVCQMVKVADGIYSGRYAVVPSEEDLEDARREREAREAEKERARQGIHMEVDKPQNHTAVKRRKQVRTTHELLHPARPCIANVPIALAPSAAHQLVRCAILLCCAVQLQSGIPPRMFKRLVAKGHTEFSGSKQQVPQHYHTTIILLSSHRSPLPLLYLLPFIWLDLLVLLRLRSCCYMWVVML